MRKYQKLGGGVTKTNNPQKQINSSET